MRTKRLVLAGIAALALAGGGGTALAVNGAAPPAAAGETAGGQAREAAAVRASAAPAASRTAGPRVVQPYQPVEIGQGATMGLLPEGRQNYVVAWEDYAGSVERAKGYAGDSIRPDSLSGGLHTEGDDALYTGAFRTGTVPARITLRIDGGAEVEAGMLRLPGDPGWGTYHYDAAGTGAPRESVTVTAYGPDGSVLADLTFRPFSAGR
ncbi:hypothetical protein ACIF80_30030 [Streptomyces sp. NPDC085927]|uniref:hypothetical protein n=1 Tax=Streptomyces sp. NPDC085927 TaxID=3365738 RepID=UPI0037D05AA0